MSDWVYRLGHALLNQTIRLYYRRIEVVGGERIPAWGPAILVANHPNSAADAFLLASELTPRRVNFLAKDTITRAPVVGPLLRRFGVVGVARAMDYDRQRDVARERNKAALSTCVPRLVAGELLAIFGEGVSTDARRLQMIRKGAMRFGYSAEREANFQLDLQWIPIGINYSAKHHFRSDVLIQVGETFRLRDLDPEQTAPEAEILQRGTARLQRAVESLTVNIEREELADLIDRLADLVASPAGSLSARLEAHQRVVRAVQYFNSTEPLRIAEMEQALRPYQGRLAAAGLTDEVIRRRHPALAVQASLLGLLKSSGWILLSFYGWANSFVPRWGAYLVGPLGRRRVSAPNPAGSGPRVELAGQALWGIYGGWAGATVAFPLQIYLVYSWAAAKHGLMTAVAFSAFYGLSLIPSWRLYIRRREIFRQH